MKNWLLPGIVIIMITFIGCHAATPNPTTTPEPTATPITEDAKTIFEVWLAAAKGIESIQEDYNGTIVMVTKGASQSTTITIEGQLHSKGNNSLEELEITVGTTKQRIRQYMSKDKVFVATMVQGQWTTAKEVTPSIYFNADEVQAEFESLYNKGALVPEARVEPRLVSGEECNELRLSADLTKLSSKDREFLLYSGGLSSVSDVGIYVDAITSFAMRFCLLPNGMMLESETTLELNPNALPTDGIVSSHIVSTITHYEINPVIPDSFFDLP